MKNNFKLETYQKNRIYLIGFSLMINAIFNYFMWDLLPNVFPPRDYGTDDVAFDLFITISTSFYLYLFILFQWDEKFFPEDPDEIPKDTQKNTQNFGKNIKKFVFMILIIFSPLIVGYALFLYYWLF
jgi:hypothetical protein